MSRKKTEMNPVRSDRVKKIIEIEKLTQKEFGKRIGYTQQNISRIVQKKQPLTEEAARLIVETFPKYRIEWLLGYDDHMTTADAFLNAIQEINEEGRLLHQGFFSLAKLSNFQIDITPLSGESGTIADTFRNMKKYCTIARDGKTVTLTLSELNDFENELCEYVELRLSHMMK
ncbi:MAG: helix-turn-helix transcriptional regulator [Anaerolineaceae bacterium]|nr:helix-turn-helix transcriptional regulator [Anaerolineaceae bacterium]